MCSQWLGSVALSHMRAQVRQEYLQLVRGRQPQAVETRSICGHNEGCGVRGRKALSCPLYPAIGCCQVWRMADDFSTPALRLLFNTRFFLEKPKILPSNCAGNRLSVPRDRRSTTVLPSFLRIRRIVINFVYLASLLHAYGISNSVIRCRFIHSYVVNHSYCWY